MTSIDLAAIQEAQLPKYMETIHGVTLAQIKKHCCIASIAILKDSNNAALRGQVSSSPLHSQHTYSSAVEDISPLGYGPTVNCMDTTCPSPCTSAPAKCSRTAI